VQGGLVNRFTLMELPLSGLKLVTRHRIGDQRGFLARLFCAEALALAEWAEPIAQINHTYTAKKGTVRGMHFQRSPHSEMKLVSCIHGEVWDVAVDMRAGSPTFLQWHAERLSAENGCAMFQALTDDVELIYCHSRAYVSEAEGGLNPTDERLEITWPLTIAELSVRDAGHPLITGDFKGVQI
jgi:dTDP-4-dehydrorhamnose 3,5-epimerase